MNFSKKCGAAAALVVAPYYNRPSQAGMIAHFSWLAEHCDLPIVLYNVPGRTVTDLKPETVCELANRFPGRIAGIKDASGDLSRVADHRLGVAGAFCQLSGDDELALPHTAAGGVGCISVTANVAPKLCAEFQAACAAGDLAKAREYQDRLMPLHDAMFCETNPGPVKYAVSLLGKCAEDLRLPMVAPADAARGQIKKA